MAYLGPQARVAGDLSARGSALLQVVGGVVGLVAAGEVRPDAGDRGAARALASAACATSACQSPIGAPPRDRPVSTLSWMRGGRAGGDDLVEALAVYAVTSTSARRPGRASRPPRRPGGSASTAASRCRRRRAGPAPRAPWPRRANARRPRGPRARLDQPVAVAVRLHDGHQRRGGDDVGQRPDVVADRGQVDHDLRTHGPRFSQTSCGAASQQVADHRGDGPRDLGCGERTALRGVRRGRAVQPRADRRGVVGSSPAASRAPMSPASTSPAPGGRQPRHAGGGDPRPPSGRATTVRRPLSSTTASYRPAASRACRSGAASMASRRRRSSGRARRRAA